MTCIRAVEVRALSKQVSLADRARERKEEIKMIKKALNRAEGVVIYTRSRATAKTRVLETPGPTGGERGVHLPGPCLRSCVDMQGYL